MTVAFKKSLSSIFDLLIRVRTGGIYVHSELVFSDGVTWRIEPGDHPAVHFVSGVQYSAGKWDIVNYAAHNEQLIREWCATQNGKRYDWIGILNFIVPFGEDDDDDLFCSEGCVLALQHDDSLITADPKLISPNGLYRLMTSGKMHLGQRKSV